MDRIAHGTARLILAAKKAWERKHLFLGLSLCWFVLSVMVLAKYDLLPDPSAHAKEISRQSPEVTVSASPLIAVATSTAHSASVQGELPVKLEIPSIALVANVANPTSTNIEVLDYTLLAGAARYPTSGKLGEKGNVVIFGHSSYLPVVNNPSYKLFNGIQKLKAGDTITVYSSSLAYTYTVRTVSKEDAKSAGIPLTVSGSVLTLSTCDSFGTPSDRFVVVADFVESHSISR